MIGHPLRTLSGRLRLARMALVLLGLDVLAGAMRGEATPRPQGKAAPHAAVTATILHNFDANTEGNAPEYGLVQGPDGSLYGVTTQTAGATGANSNIGIVFKVAPDGTGFTVLHAFTNGTDGFTPGSRLLLDGGLLLGTCTTGGGDNEAGTVFVIDPSQVSAGNNAAGFSVLHYFQETIAPFTPGVSQLVSNPTDGASPNGSLFLASDGSVYGTTYGPSANGTGGTIFHLQPDSSGHFSVTAPDANHIYQFGGTYTTIYNFNGGSATPNPANGANPLGGVIQLSDGFLYGTTYRGGSTSGTNGNSVSFGDGTVYKIAPDGSGFTILHSFTGGIVITNGAVTSVGDGESPECDLIQAADGNLYGTTYFGGPGGVGTVFQIKPDSSGGFSANSPFGTIAALNNNTGNEIAGGVIQASDGDLYGTTLTGGAGGSGNGSVFQITPNPSTGKFDAVADPLVYGQAFPDPFATIYTFLGQNNPQSVASPLIQGLDGRLYGESLRGGQLTDGSGAGGTVFALSAGLPAPVVPLVVTAVTGSLNPPAVTTAAQDTVLVIHGRNFAAGDTVAIDGQNAPVTARNNHISTDEQITVTLAAPLSAGTHTVTVADIPADGTRVSSPFSFTVTLLSPQITQVTNGSGGAVTSIDTTLLILGNSFAAGDSVNFSAVYVGTTLTRTVNSGGRITVMLSQGLPAGDEKITVTHAAPDGRASNVYDLTVQAGPAPAITGVTGATNPPAVTTNDTSLTVHGTGFAATDTVSLTGAGLPAGESVVTGAVTADPSNAGGENLPVTLSAPLPAGTYDATVTHASPDGRASAPFPFTVAAAAPPKITATAYRVTGGQGVLTINGTGFVHGSTLTVTPNNPNVTLGGTLTAAYVSPTQLTGAFSQPLPPGVYTVTVTNPDNQSATGKAYVLAVTGVNYSLTTLKVTLSGAGFAPGATVSASSDASSGAISVQSLTVSPDGLTITVTPAHALSAGHITFVVTNPDGQTGSADLYLPAISSVRYTVTASGYQLLIAGAGFDPQASVTVDGAALTVASRSETQITATGSPALTPGRHPVTVTNGDGAGTSFTITVSAAPAISASGGTFLTNSSGSTLLVITGTNFVTSVNSAVYPNFTAGAYVDGTFEAASEVDTGTNSSGEVLEQLFIPVGTKFGEGPHSIIVRNPDGNGSDGSIVTPQARAGGKAVLGLAVSPRASATTAQIYNSDHTSYVASVSPQNSNPILQAILSFLNGLFHFGLSGGTNAAPTRVVPHDVDAISNAALPIQLMTTGGGVITGIVAQGGGNIVAQGGGNIVAQGGGNIVAQGGGNIVAQGGGNIVAQGGGNIVAQGGGNVISNDGGSARPRVASSGVTIYNLLGTLDNTGNANSLDFQSSGAAGSARPRAATAAGGTPGSFAFQKSDQSGQGTGPSDFTVTAQAANGSTITLLQMRFTPGQPDQVLYATPGLVLTPTGNTPAPMATAGVVQVTPGAFRAEHGHEGQLSQLFTLANPTGFAVAGRLGLAVSGLPAGVSVMGASGGAVPASTTGLAAGATMQVRVYFSAPGRPGFADTAQAVAMP